MGLISGQLVTIDDSKFQAVASQRKHLNLTKLKRQQAKLEAQISRYLAELDEADRSDVAEVVDRSAVKAALQHLESRHADNLTVQALMAVQGLDQFVVGEDEARMMRTHQGARVAYNVQSAVDGKHRLIVHHAITQNGAITSNWNPWPRPPRRY